MEGRGEGEYFVLFCAEDGGEVVGHDGGGERWEIVGTISSSERGSTGGNGRSRNS